MRRFLLIIIALLCPTLSSLAQRVDIITTTSGNIYEGYISKQVVGGDITIVSSRTSISVSTKDADVELSRVRKRMLGDLPQEYAAYFPLLSDESEVKTATVIVTDKSGTIEYPKSVILEEGTVCRFVSFSTQPFNVKISDIWLSTKVPYNFSSESGIYDQISLNNGDDIDGQMLSEDLVSRVIRFRRKFDGSIISFSKDDVLSLRCKQVNPENDIWTQIPYCDRICKTDGTVLEGVIRAKRFGKKIEFQVIGTYDEMVTIPVKDIERYEKYPNGRYSLPILDLDEGEEASNLYVNGESYSTSPLVHEKDKYKVKREVDSLKINLMSGSRTVFRYKARSRTSSLRVAKAKLQKEHWFSQSNVLIKDNGTKFYPVFKERDVASQNFDINFQENDNNYMQFDLSFDTSGVYVIFIEGSNECIAVNVRP